MGFDRNSRRPLVAWRRWTTEINLGTVVGVAVFLVLGALMIFFWHRKSVVAATAPVGVLIGK